MRKSSDSKANHFRNRDIYPCDAMKFVGVGHFVNNQGE